MTTEDRGVSAHERPVRPQRWTGSNIHANQTGGFVSIGDYLALERAAAMLAVDLAEARASLKKANEQTERFERGWYLRGDALEAIKKHCDPNPSALAVAIVATCNSGLSA